ncbi:super-infection exclusion protein B, partial [Escherichia coli]
APMVGEAHSKLTIKTSTPCRNPVMKKLERKGIIQHQSDSANCSYYLVTEKYSHFMKLFWNSRSRRFNR